MYGLIQSLFGKAGGVFIVPIEDVIPTPDAVQMCFLDVAIAALGQGMVCLGYKSKDEQWMAMADWMKEDAVHGITWINPQDKLVPRTWKAGDMLVVIA